MRILMIGGTRFLGRAMVEEAVSQGHTVTLFNRGQSNRDLFPDLEHLHGDRDRDLSALQGRQWDIAIDTCGYIPRHVRMTAELLADAVEHYTFISSISVYSRFSAGMDEYGPLGLLDDPTVEQITGETYGPLKVLCEQAAEAAMPGRVLHMRAGLIVGRYDPTDRFSYWPLRVARGGDFVAPGGPQYPVQFIDVRDISAFTLALAATHSTGVYNVTGPERVMTLGEVITTSQQITGARATPVWMDKDFLLANDVQPWVELPLWIPESEDNSHTMNQVSNQKAVQAGLTFHPLAETISDLFTWAAARPADYTLRAGLSAEKERALLEKWQQQ